eukprot:6083804-Prymnesium_polylepis.1
MPSCLIANVSCTGGSLSRLDGGERRQPGGNARSGDGAVEAAPAVARETAAAVVSMRRLAWTVVLDGAYSISQKETLWCARCRPTHATNNGRWPMLSPKAVSGHYARPA